MRPIMTLFFILLFSSASQTVRAEDAAVESFQVPEAGFTILYPKGSSAGSPPHRTPDVTGALVDIDFSIQYGDVWLQDIKVHSLESVSTFAKKQKGNGVGIKESLVPLNEMVRQKKEFREQTGYRLIGETKFRSNCQPKGANDGNNYQNSITFIGDTRVTVVMGSKNECEKSSEEFRKVLAGIRFN